MIPRPFERNLRRKLLAMDPPIDPNGTYFLARVLRSLTEKDAAELRERRDALIKCEVSPAFREAYAAELVDECMELIDDMTNGDPDVLAFALAECEVRKWLASRLDPDRWAMKGSA